MKKSEPVYAGSASADAVYSSVIELFENFRDAAAVMPATWIASAIADLAAATVHTDAGRRGDGYRRALKDLHEALNDANGRLNRARAATTRPPLRALVG